MTKMVDSEGAMDVMNSVLRLPSSCGQRRLL